MRAMSEPNAVSQRFKVSLGFSDRRTRQLWHRALTFGMGRKQTSHQAYCHRNLPRVALRASWERIIRPDVVAARLALNSRAPAK